MNRHARYIFHLICYQKIAGHSDAHAFCAMQVSFQIIIQAFYSNFDLNFRIYSPSYAVGLSTSAVLSLTQDSNPLHHIEFIN